jgi:hypothetical protein
MRQATDLANHCCEFAAEFRRWPASAEELREYVSRKRPGILDDFERLEFHPRPDGGTVVEYALRKEAGKEASGRLTLPPVPRVPMPAATTSAPAAYRGAPAAK